MWKFTELANWWDKRNTQAHNALDQIVEDSGYNQGIILIASTAHAFTVFGAGAVDLLRLGDGIKSRTWGGAGQDALRAVAVFPVGKVVNAVKTSRGIEAAKLIADIDTARGICSWVASAKALRQIGLKQPNGKLYASVEDLAKAAGVSVNSIGPIHLHSMVETLRRLGAGVSDVRRIKTMRDAESMIPADGGVVLVTVRAIMHYGQDKAHAFYVFRHRGFLTVMDRTVNGFQSTYRSLDDLLKSYAQNVKQFRPEEAAVLKNVYAKSVGFEAPVLAIPVLGILGEDK